MIDMSRLQAGSVLADVIGWCHQCATFQRFCDAPIRVPSWSPDGGVLPGCANCGEMWEFGVEIVFPDNSDQVNKEGRFWEDDGTWQYPLCQNYVPCAANHIGESLSLLGCNCPESKDLREALAKEQVEYKALFEKRSAASRKGWETRRGGSE